MPLDDRPLLTAGQALIRLLLTQAERDAAAGLDTAGYVSGYRGSPLGGFDQELARAQAELTAHRVVFQPGLNEELAATALWGTQQVGLFPGARHAGVFGLWYGKGPGVDRAGVALKHANLAGTAPLGGVLAVAGDDHAASSSTTAHQSEFAFVDAMIPVLAPADVQEVHDLGLMGLALSRFAGCWVALKLAADVAESAGAVTLDAPAPVAPRDFQPPPGGLHIRWPDRALDQEARLHGPKLAAVHAFARANRLDRIVRDAPGARRGIVAVGKAWGDLAQALADLGLDGARLAELGLDGARLAELGLRIYKPALVWPLEPEALLRFADGLDEILVIEEKRPLVEDQIARLLYDRAARPRLLGKRDTTGATLLPSAGELAPATVARALARWLGWEDARASAPARRDKPPLRRTPHYCPGCPHSRSTRVPEGSRALAGIGCHTMALWSDAQTQTLTQMGGEGASWIGQAPFTDTRHVFQNLGDGTFAHSGLLAIRAAIAAKVTLTYKLLYNDAVAMTGGQAVEGALTVPRVARILEAEGVARIVVVAEEPERYPASDPFPPGARVVGRVCFDDVQRELADVPGVTVLIYDQTCAAEKRRRRKRGSMPQPTTHVVINEQLCEGCGDCAAASDCLSVVPVETEWGRKRRIDAASCNVDLACLDGFCPSLVTVEGARQARPQRIESPTTLPPEPALPALDAPRAMLIAGIGGTGMVTLGRVLARAAHESGYAVSLADQTGLAQKGGAVLVHLRLAPRGADSGAARIGAHATVAARAIDGADLILGGDLVTAASDEVLARAKPGARAVVDAAATITGAFLREPDKDFPAADLHRRLRDKLGDAALATVDAAALARRAGHAAGANMALLGAAWQQGLLPLALEPLRAAIAAEAPDAEANLAAFDAGRAAAVGDATPASATPPTLDGLIAARAAFLADYQNAALAARYRATVAAIRETERALGTGRDDLARAVAGTYAKLLAYKDEYEAARLLTAPAFAAEVARDFGPDARVRYHLAPAWLPRRRGAGGRPGKYRFGPWLAPALRTLARLRGLRGTPLDPFRFGADRRLERALIREYERTLAEISAHLTVETHDACVALARWPDSVRGFGHIKRASADAARQQRDDMLAALAARRAAPTPTLAAE